VRHGVSYNAIAVASRLAQPTCHGTHQETPISIEGLKVEEKIRSDDKAEGEGSRINEHHDEGRVSDGKKWSIGEEGEGVADSEGDTRRLPNSDSL